jgi:hypothetical protein
LALEGLGTAAEPGIDFSDETGVFSIHASVLTVDTLIPKSANSVSGGSRGGVIYSAKTRNTNNEN